MAGKKKNRAGAKTDGVFIECKECHKSKALSTNFYKSNRPEYAETGYCDVCKSCMKEMMIDEKTGMINKDVFENKICYMINIPFVPSEYNKVLKNPKITPSNFFSEYRKLIMLNREYREMAFGDSVNFVNDEAGLLKKTDKNYDQVTEEMIEFWGSGFSAEYYLDVQKRFDKFMEFEDLDKMDYKKESDYKTLCQLERKKTEMLQSKDTKPSEIKSIVDTISSLSNDLNIKALQKKNDENDTGHYIVGLVTKYIEDVKLTPIPKLENIDWLGDMPKSEFDIEMAYFKSEMLNELGYDNPYQEIVDEDKKKYSPSQEDLDIARMGVDATDEEGAL